MLVTGGAGYIGSVCVEELIRHGHTVVVIDDLSQGHKEAVIPDVVLCEGDIGDNNLLESVFKLYAPEVVIHFAAETVIELSMSDPSRYFINNLTKGIILLDAMRKYHCNKMIFSSTAAIFGEPLYSPIDEKHPQIPINAYGESKLMFEKVLDWYNKCYGLKFNSFRYFNAVGASERLGEDHRPETHLIPVILKAALAGKTVTIYGADYPTKDGTCVRDYVHVIDLAQAHILALDNLDIRSAAKYNLGNNIGYTNLDVVKMCEKVSGKKINFRIGERRRGDPAKLIASSLHAKNELGWKPQHESLELIIESAWKWSLQPKYKK